jgi:hypothetical protein
MLTYTEEIPRQCSQTTPPEALPQLGSIRARIVSRCLCSNRPVVFEPTFREMGRYIYLLLIATTIILHAADNPCLYHQYHSSTINRARDPDPRSQSDRVFDRVARVYASVESTNQPSKHSRCAQLRLCTRRRGYERSTGRIHVLAV